jgi:hypothetical protein
MGIHFTFSVAFISRTYSHCLAVTFTASHAFAVPNALPRTNFARTKTV